MNKVLLLFMVLIIFSCQNNEKQTDATSEPEATSINYEEDQADEEDQIEESEPESQEQKEDLPPPKIEKDEKTIKGEEKRAEQSVVKNEKCCSSLKKVETCCCLDILKKYKNMLEKSEYDNATTLKAKDPFFLACQQQQKNFDSEIVKIEDEVFGEE